ncbi:SDR family mycofactocin-dependent oxidoreductase [Williamsia sp. 1138]|uniref:mycofactocin-coupled SDR family oxidoreductase n=1 Tax=Williamsia sp. 1138 TaxID=1903117 RepID=UPI000A10588C|nr:mycofactocin-coupled SDR family oxidoreductase [Williamsia sp. 1138]OZG26320.1 SDR family mycofactocin-dependent oxidoreductase [Williamsia sp. 1138]
MNGRLEGKVAFVTGAARGQGRSHAIRMAQEGADIIAVDICQDIATVTAYDLATEADLQETVRQVEALDRRIVARTADVRDLQALTQAVDEGVAELGRLDIVVANAGIFSHALETHQLEMQSWVDVIDVNLTGVFTTVKAAIPHVLETGEGGSVILVSSLAGTKGLASLAAYTAAKHGVVGLMKVLANEYGKYGIRVNTINPNAIGTEMVQNETLYKIFRPDLEHPTLDDALPAFAGMNPFGVPFIDPVHVSNAVVFLASEESKYVAGVQLQVDAAAAIA